MIGAVEGPLYELRRTASERSCWLRSTEWGKASTANIFASVKPGLVMSGLADAKPVPVKVEEYWILEKVGWYDEGWRIRDAYGDTEKSLQVKV